MRMISWIAAVALMGVCGISNAELVWQTKPGGLEHNHEAAPRAPAGGEGQRSGHAGHGGRGEGTAFYLGNQEGLNAELWKPTLERVPLAVEESGRVAVRPTGMDNYHLLVATRETEGRIEMALRYLPQSGRPTGNTPAQLTAAAKGLLEIVPAPLPREHRRYTAINDPANFIVRFRGEPLPNTLVQLQTSIGSLREAVTDQKGRVSFVLPDDFPEVKPGRRGNRPADFVVRVEHQDGGKAYWTTLSAPYHVSPSYWQSTRGGLAIAAAGFFAGLVWTRGSRQKNQGVSA